MSGYDKRRPGGPATPHGPADPGSRTVSGPGPEVERAAGEGMVAPETGQLAADPDALGRGTPSAPDPADHERHGNGALLRSDARDKLAQRLEGAVNGFVDRPKESLREADAVYEEITELVPQALAARRQALRASWEDAADTENLRLALRRYREATERLLGL